MFVEDLTVFFDASGFGTQATLAINGVNSTVNVIFDAAYIDPLGEFASSQPVAWLETPAATIVPQRDTLTVNAVTYDVVEVRPDGLGVTQLRLRT